MKRGRDLVGMPIINLSSGETIGRVQDVYFDPDSHQVTGIVMDGGGWLKGPRKICFVDLAGVGNDAITISDESVILKEPIEEECIIAGDGTVIGNRVMTRDGNELGTIADVVFDHATGAISHYQLSEGLIQDLLEGRETIPADTEFTYGKDAIIVDLNLE